MNTTLNGPKLCTHSKFSPLRGNGSMFDLAYYNPKLSGNVYRGTRKCGKNNCRCATSPKNKHPFWRLEYRIRHNGRWRRKREYVPKNKVKSLRQRIKRAKQKDQQCASFKAWLLPPRKSAQSHATNDSATDGTQNIATKNLASKSIYRPDYHVKLKRKT